ncbi:GFA family protein [Agrobacterium larrymoorei]|uniref:GFA family protein n=1 Tax=Agrobacterium larrymoorei TaxID=160699 RepID=A0A4D7DUN9_9HYPH|nr:GFA family protein [Agrobacterium larrymoorei]QCI98219.1 GFA family protein [Agrobacterium larrymoorei]QYA06330.1 GFA family protein [Agrobacterium larrymoorei]
MTIYTGGCQCGAIRFRVEGVLKNSSICHCRMCQKAFGAYYAPLVSVRGADFKWTRGEPKRFQSSNHVKRGFCSDCGTPLTYEAPDGIAVAAGAFDDPSALPPVIQWGTENKIGFVDRLHLLPGEETEADVTSASFIADLVSYQHPDHDTSEWSEEKSR